MKILNVASTIDPVTGGGEAERSYQMSKALAQSGADCRVLTIDTGLGVERTQFLGQGGVVALPCMLRRFYVPRVSFKEIDSLVAEADVIHLMGHWSVLNALVYWAARKRHKSYVVCPAGALAIFGRSRWLKIAYNWLIGSRIVRDAAMCIAVTPAETEVIMSYGVQADRIRVIPNGIAAEDFAVRNDAEFRNRHGLGERPFLLFVGRLNPIKGPDILLQAYEKVCTLFPEVDLVYAGPDGGMLNELKAWAKEKALEGRVHFLGYIGGKDKSQAYHAAQLLVIPSRQEAMSIVVLEAGVCATPVVLTDQCGFNQLQEIGGGWVVPATVEGVASGIIAALSDPEKLGAAGSHVSKFVLDRYTWGAMVREYWTLYARLLAHSGSADK